MPTKTFQINLFDGHAIIENNENIILVDTGSPTSIHTHNSLNFMDFDFRVSQNYGGITIPALCDLVGTRITTLLGMDRLADYKIIFDYPNRTITFSNEDDLEFEGESVGLTFVHDIPVIDAVINMRIFPCFLDSGAKLSYLKAVETQNCKNLGNVGDFYPGVGRFQTPTFEIETQVGNRRFPALYGNLPRTVENQLLTLVDGNNGIIGYDFLRKYKIFMNTGLNELKIAN